MNTYRGNYNIGNCSEDFIKAVAKKLKSEFIYSKAMDMYGIKYQGIDILFYDTLVAVAEPDESIDKIYSSIFDIEQQIEIIKNKKSCN